MLSHFNRTQHFKSLTLKPCTHLDGVDPLPDVEEGPLVRTVVQQEDAVSAPEVRLGDGPEPGERGGGLVRSYRGIGVG